MNKAQSNQCQSSLRQEIPWYLNGTLSEAETTRVRQHIEGCADCRSDLELHSGMQSAVLGREVTPILPKTKAAQIHGIGRSGVSPRAGGGPIALYWLAVAAGAAIIAVAVTVTLYPGSSSDVTNQIFETATSTGSTEGIDYVLQVQFEDGLSEAERNAITKQLEGAVKWAVNDNGVYEIHVQLQSPSLAVLEEYEQRTGALPGVQSAKFTALQLPMR